MKDNEPAQVVKRFHEATGVKMHGPLAQSVATAEHLEDLEREASLAIQEARAERQAVIKNDLTRQIQAVYDHADKGGSYADLALDTGAVERADEALADAETKQTRIRKATEVSRRVVLDRIRDPKAKLIEKAEAAWASQVHHNLDPAKATVVEMEEAKARASLVVDLVRQVVAYVDAPASGDEGKRLAAAFEQRPIEMPRLEPIRSAIYTEDSALRQAAQAKAARLSGMAASFTGTHVEPHDRTPVDKEAVAAVARRRSGNLRPEEVSA